MARERRTKSQIITDDIKTIEEKIAGLKEKIEEYNTKKAELETTLAEILEEEARAKEETDMKELIKLMKKKKVSFDDLKDMLSGENEVAATTEE